MARAAVSEDEFITTWRRCGGSPKAVALALGVNERNVYARRARLADRGVTLHSVPSSPAGTVAYLQPHRAIQARLEARIDDGTVVVFSDAHYWPDNVTVAHRALLAAIERLRPVMVIANGDVLDGAALCRQERIGWETKPTIAAEIIECKARLDEIEAVAGVDCRLVWTRGNHDIRLDRALANSVPALEGVPGMSLPDHFPRWQHTVSLMLNPHAGSGAVMVKHRHANGIHATFNNTVKGGCNVVTGHLHRLTVTAWGDYTGRRYGVDTGTLAEPHGPQFSYAEDNPSPHASGFAVLTFSEGHLLPPELAEIRDGRAFFRGAEIVT